MVFLTRDKLTAAIKRLSKTKGRLKCAVAYWGKDGIKLTGINPKRRNVQIVCCLKGGKSDPDLIKKFGYRARQHDRLHAKVFWTDKEAIIGSANASSNGMPEEEGTADGLLEAGFLVKDPIQLASIENWFGQLYKRSRKIKSQDLAMAREARKRRIFGEPKARKQSLIRALREGGKLEFGKQKISIVLWNERTTIQQNAVAKSYVAANKQFLADAYKVDQSQLDKLDWFLDWPGLPRDTFLIDCECSGHAIKRVTVAKTFPTTKLWKMMDKTGGWQNVVYVATKPSDFGYLLTPADVKLIKKRAKELWTLGIKEHGGESHACVFPLLDAAPLLLK
jgi:hypothetical protein